MMAFSVKQDLAPIESPLNMAVNSCWTLSVTFCSSDWAKQLFVIANASINK
jgi:hypothetical protein